jgi:hypothetical protein
VIQYESEVRCSCLSFYPPNPPSSASPSGMQQISLNFEDPLSSYDYPRSNLETIAEKELSSMCSNWTLKGVEDLREWYSVNADSLDKELSDLLSKKPKKSKTMSSVASTNATGQTDRENAEYYNTLRRLQVCIIHGTYVEDGPLLDEGIPSDAEEYFEKWRARLAREYETKCKELPDSIVWKKLWNACFAARVHPKILDGETMFNLFRSLLEQLSSIDTLEAAPEDTLSSPALENGDGAQGKADRVPEAENKD